MNKLISLLTEKENIIAKLRGSHFQEYGQRGTKQYFQMIKNTAQSQIMTAATINNITTTDPTKIADHVWDYYSKAFEKDENLDSTTTFLENPIFNIMKNIFLNCQHLQGDITNIETIQGTLKLNSHSVPGWDGATAAMITKI